MELQNKYNPPASMISEYELSSEVAVFMSKTYSWMTVGLATTGLVAWQTFESGLVFQVLDYFWLLLIGLLAFVFFFSSKVYQLNTATVSSLFLVYSGLNGLVLSSIFLVYEIDVIYDVFFITAGVFAASAAYGYFTKKSLVGMGYFMRMGLFGVIIAMVINMFLGSSMLHTTIAIISVLVFTGLTAWESQNMKDLYIEMRTSDKVGNLAIASAFSLYLNFINLFLALLRLFGSSKD